MPKATEFDEKVFKRVSTSEVECLVCSAADRNQKIVFSRHVTKHKSTSRHKQNEHQFFKKKHAPPLLEDAICSASSVNTLSPAISLGDNLQEKNDHLAVSIEPSFPFDPSEEITFKDVFEFPKTIYDDLGFNDDNLNCDDWDFLGEDLPTVPPQVSDIPDVCPENTQCKPGAPFPWPSMEMFKTHLLFSSPRLCFSSAQKKAIINWAADMGMTSVPTYYAYTKFQDDFMVKVGERTALNTSANGTVFYLNDIARSIAEEIQDFANPATWFAMEDYAEDKGSQMEEARHAKKMLIDIPSEVTTPTIRVKGKIFYVNEILKCSTGTYFIPGHLNGGTKYCRTDTGFVVSTRMKKVPVSDFLLTLEDIEEHEGRVQFSEESKSFRAKMPHPLRERAEKRMVYSVPLIIFMDDVSGNISKQWNKHHVAYMSNALLPRKLIEKERCVRFVSSSPHATPMELVKGIVDSIKKAAQSGVVAWDCMHEEEVLLTPYILFWAGDNPMQAEVCSQAGLACNFFCRTCDVGGSKQYKCEDDGFLTLFESGNQRTPAQTLETCKSQLNMAVEKGGTTKISHCVTETGIHDSNATSTINALLAKGRQMRRGGQSETNVQTSLKEELTVLYDDLLNPLLTLLGLDIHQDTPTEILHTVLLGVVKYFWGQTTHQLEKLSALQKFQARLASINIKGLNVPELSAEYICKFKGSLIGKHFKTLSQIMPFLVHDLVSPSLVKAWRVVGELNVLIWHTSIDNLDRYLVRLKEAINNVLDATAECVPKIITTKPKFHFLVHIPDFIQRFGPIILCSTERYESYNHVFRLTQVFSNQQAQSRDACLAFAKFDAVKHIAQGGYVQDTQSSRWVQADQIFLDYVAHNRRVQTFLGLGDETLPTRGKASVTLYARSSGKRATCPPPIPWIETKCSKLQVDAVEHNGEYYIATDIVAENGDKISVRDFAIVHNPDPAIVCVVEILIPAKSPTPSGKTIALHVCVEILELGPPSHSVLSYPSITLTSNMTVIKPKALICAVNAQHNCELGNCKEGEQSVRQERLVTIRQRAVIVHSETPHFLLNVNSLHNHKEIHATVDFFRDRVSGDDPLLPLQSSTQESVSLHKKAAEQLRKDKTSKTTNPNRHGSESDRGGEDSVPESAPPHQQVQRTSRKPNAKRTAKATSRNDATPASRSYAVASTPTPDSASYSFPPVPTGTSYSFLPLPTGASYSFPPVPSGEAFYFQQSFPSASTMHPPHSFLSLPGAPFSFTPYTYPQLQPSSRVSHSPTQSTGLLSGSLMQNSAPIGSSSSESNRHSSSQI